MYTGNLRYENIEFTFVFDGKKLKLIPPKKENAKKWLGKRVGKIFKIEEKLVGECNETSGRIIFVPVKARVELFSLILTVDVKYYIVGTFVEGLTGRIAIQGPEIDHIYPTTIALERQEIGEGGVVNIGLKPLSETSSEKEVFKVGDKEVKIYFGIGVSVDYGVGKAPLGLNSVLFLEFEPTEDYDFIIKLLELSKNFIRYLCYRRDIVFASVELSTPTPDALYRPLAMIYECGESDKDVDLSKGERSVKYEYIKGVVGRIMEDILGGKMYLEHIPDTYKSGRRINAGRFVMITAGFEWEFKRNYPGGVKKDEGTLAAEEGAAEALSKLVNSSSGKLKGIFKFLKKLIRSDSLELKIVQYGKDYGEISNIFGDYLYELNGESLRYPEMGKRLSKQRNNFAHGNIDQKFEGLALLDLMYLEYIIYIMQLKFCGIEDGNAKRAVNDLFGCHMSM